MIADNSFVILEVKLLLTSHLTAILPVVVLVLCICIPKRIYFGGSTAWAAALFWRAGGLVNVLTHVKLEAEQRLPLAAKV